MKQLAAALVLVLTVPSVWAIGDLQSVHSIQRQIKTLIHQGRSMEPLRHWENPKLRTECWQAMKAHQAKAKELRDQIGQIPTRAFFGVSVDLDSAVVKTESCVSCQPDAKGYCDSAQKYLKLSKKDLVGASSPQSEGPVDVKLPPISKRVIVGTWLVHLDSLQFTRSIEKVRSKYYMVERFKDHTGGDTGSPLSKIKSHTFRPIPPDSSGDYYVIKKNGSLALMDDDGLIAVLPMHKGLWPAVENAETNQPPTQNAIAQSVALTGNSAVVTKTEFGAKWPLKVNRATIECREHSRIVLMANGKTYWFNGLASGAAKSQGWSNLRDIWLDDPSWGIPGAKKDIGPLENIANKLCPYTGY